MQTLADAARDAVPIVVGYVTLGLAAGMLLVAEGLAWWWAPVWSLVIYSGTMQMLLVPLTGAGEPLAAIALSTGFVSGTSSTGWASPWSGCGAGRSRASTPSTRSPTRSTRCWRRATGGP